MSEAKSVVLNVTGMTCQGCVNSVTRIVKRADPAAEVAIDLPTGRLAATTAASAQALAAAIAAAGYGAQVA
jgi:copper chaperone